MAHVIQLSVAPVFLLSGIGALLSVLSNRVGRIVDRCLQIEERNAHMGEYHTESLGEIDRLSRRVRLANWAISLCTTCALLICTMIVILFSGAFLNLDVSSSVALLFIAAMTTLIGGLLCFLREVHLAIASLKLRRRVWLKGKGKERPG